LKKIKRNAERKQKRGGKVNGVAEYRAIKAENTYEGSLRDSSNCSMH